MYLGIQTLYPTNPFRHGLALASFILQSMDFSDNISCQPHFCQGLQLGAFDPAALLLHLHLHRRRQLSVGGNPMGGPKGTLNVHSRLPAQTAFLVLWPSQLF